MTDDYIAKTIAAYNKSPQKYIDATKRMIPYQEIDEFLKDIPKGSTILDAGCAYGRDTIVFREKGYKPIGIDLSKEFIKRAKNNYPEIDFRIMSITDLDFSGETFNGIWCIATMLHLKKNDIEKSLKEFYRVIKKGGKLFLTFKKGMGSKSFVESFSSNSERFYTFQTKESLEKLLKDAGFTITNIYYLNEQKRWGKNYRDLEWVYAFAKK